MVEPSTIISLWSPDCINYHNYIKMWPQKLVGLFVGLATLAVTLVWFLEDEWIRFHDANGYIPGEVTVGLSTICGEGICLPIKEEFTVYSGPSKNLAISGMALYAFFFLSAITCTTCSADSWKNTYLPLGSAIGVNGLFSTSAGAMYLLQGNDMIGLIAAVFHYQTPEVTAVQPGWCAILAIVAGIVQMMIGAVFYEVGHSAYTGDDDDKVVVVQSPTTGTPTEAQGQQTPSYIQFAQPSPSIDGSTHVQYGQQPSAPVAYEQPPAYDDVIGGGPAFNGPYNEQHPVKL